MVTVEELQNKKAELEVQYNNLVKLGEEKEAQYKEDMQNIRDNLNFMRGQYKAYEELIESFNNDLNDVECAPNECDPDGCCNTTSASEE